MQHLWKYVKKNNILISYLGQSSVPLRHEFFFGDWRPQGNDITHNNKQKNDKLDNFHSEKIW